MARQLVLDAIKLARDSTDYLFPLRFKDDLPLDPHTLARAMRCFADDLDAGDAAPGIQTLKAEPPTPHDLRRTFATRLSALGVPKEDRDACMNHVPTDVGSKHYDLYDRQEEKRRALNLWAAALANILEGKKHAANVVAMRRRS